MSKYYRTIFLLIVTFFLSCSVMSQSLFKRKLTETQIIQKMDKYPSYRQIVTYFFNNYEYPQNEYYLSFAKKPDGWYVYGLAIPELKVIINFEKIWDYSKNEYPELKKYNKLNAPIEKGSMLDVLNKLSGNTINDSFYRKNKASINNDINSFIQFWIEMEFGMEPYYGYLGCMNDVIKLLSPIDLKTDRLNYSLARNYSHYSSTFIRDDYECFSKPKDPAAGYERISPERLKNYLFYANKALEHFYMVYQINPHFNTIVGSIYTKYCNENVAVYLNLMSVKEEQLAKTFLKDSLYNQQSLAFAKNILISCPANSILITNTDNDTYIPMYLQAKYGFRPDVSLANFQLMFSGWYIDMLSNKMFNANPLEFSFDISKISGDLRTNVLCYEKTEPLKFAGDSVSTGKLFSFEMPDNSKKEDHYLNLDDALKIAFSDDAKYKSKPWDDESLISIPNNKFFIRINKENVKKYNLVDDQYAINIIDTIKFDFDKYNMFRHELVLLDLISTTDWKRPICFGADNGKEAYLSLDSFLMNRGKVYQLVPVKMSDTTNHTATGWINPQIVYNNLMKNFSYPNYYEKYFIADENMIEQSNIYRKMFAQLATTFLKANDSLKALEVLAYSEKVIPDEKVKYDSNAINYSEVYYATNNTSRADRIIIALLDDFRIRIQNAKSTTSTTDFDKAAIKHCLESILLQCKKNNRNLLYSKTANLLKEL